jgi:hypothetical protein
MVGGTPGHVPHPAVMVAGTTQSMVMQVLQSAVVDTTAAQPETDSSVAVASIWLRAGAALLCEK